MQLTKGQAYLKDPTPGYLYPAVDLLAGHDDIRARLAGHHYTNEYVYQ